jgi:hypothetical protein
MDEKMNFSEHVDFMVGKAFAMLGFIRRLSFEFRDAYTTRSWCVRNWKRCLWIPLYDVRVDEVERVQRQFIRYALRGLDWMDTYDLPPYEHRRALMRLDTLVKWRSISCIMW